MTNKIRRDIILIQDKHITYKEGHKTFFTLPSGIVAGVYDVILIPKYIPELNKEVEER